MATLSDEFLRSKQIDKCLRSYLETGSYAEAAQSVGNSISTTKDWVRQTVRYRMSSQLDLTGSVVDFHPKINGTNPSRTPIGLHWIEEHRKALYEGMYSERPSEQATLPFSFNEDPAPEPEPEPVSEEAPTPEPTGTIHVLEAIREIKTFLDQNGVIFNWSMSPKPD